MLTYGENEELVIRYPTEMKKLGKGMLYITSHRLCFESDGKDLVFNLDYGNLFDWEPKEESIIVRWHKPNTEQPEHSHAGPLFEAEFKLLKKAGKKVDPMTVHYTLYYVYIWRYPYGESGLGLYIDGEMLRHRFYPGQPISFQRTSADSAKHQKSEDMLLCKSAGLALDSRLNDMRRSELERIFEEKTEFTILDQLIYRHRRMLRAHIADGRWEWANGLARSDSYKVMKRIIEKQKTAINSQRSSVERLELSIDNCERNNQKSRLEVKDRWIGSYETYRVVNMYDAVKHLQDSIKMHARTIEIIEKGNYKFISEFHDMDFVGDIISRLLEKVSNGEDISTWYPEFGLRPSNTVEAERDILAHRQMQVEIP